MITYLFVGVGSFLAGVVLVLLLRRKKRLNLTRTNLNRFNFDKQKRYEKDGRRYPFSS